MSTNLKTWERRVAEMQQYKRVGDLIARHGEPRHKVQQAGFEIWHYPLGVASGMLYSVHVSVWPDASCQAFMFMEPTSIADSPAQQSGRRPLNRRIAIVLAVATMWVLSWIGFVVLMHPDDWDFIGLHGYDYVTLAQVGGFFLAWAGAQFPAAIFAGTMMGFSDFKHRLRATFWTLAAYESVFSIVRVPHWFWWAYPGLDQSVPVLAYVLALIFLIGVGVFSAWFSPKYFAFFRRHSRKVG